MHTPRTHTQYAPDGVQKILIGNKADEEHKRQVAKEQGLQVSWGGAGTPSMAAPPKKKPSGPPRAPCTPSIPRPPVLPPGMARYPNPPEVSPIARALPCTPSVARTPVCPPKCPVSPLMPPPSPHGTQCMALGSHPTEPLPSVCPRACGEERGWRGEVGEGGEGANPLPPAPQNHIGAAEPSPCSWPGSTAWTSTKQVPAAT